MLVEECPYARIFLLFGEDLESYKVRRNVVVALVLSFA
jgi:hypothetical protein